MTQVWLNGALYDSVRARIDPADRGFTLGDGLFETFAVRDGRIRRLEQHLKRLHRGCEVLRLPPPQDALPGAIHAVLAANGLRDAAVRVTYTRGAGARGLPPPKPCNPTLFVSAAPLPPPRAPASCIIASVTRRNEYSPLSRIKSTNYLDAILAREEAERRGAGDAILLNTAGNVAEATASNLFIVKNERVMTPCLEDGALEGIMREEVIVKTGAIQCRLPVQDLISADEVFLSNSLGLQAVTAIDGKKIADGSPGSIFRWLAASMD